MGTILRLNDKGYDVVSFDQRGFDVFMQSGTE
jgi:hypothetical protein